MFVSMIVTSFLSLQRIGIGAFTLLKNLSNFITIVGDYYFFGKTYAGQASLEEFSSFMELCRNYAHHICEKALVVPPMP